MGGGGGRWEELRRGEGRWEDSGLGSREEVGGGGRMYTSRIKKICISVGLLEEPQKFQIQFLELHVNFYIVDNTELPNMRRPV